MNTIERIEARKHCNATRAAVPPYFLVSPDEWAAIRAVVETARRLLPTLPAEETCCGFPVGGYMDNNYVEPPSCCGNPVFPHRELREALSKLEN
jgi:hypothetical protein